MAEKKIPSTGFGCFPWKLLMGSVNNFQGNSDFQACSAPEVTQQHTWKGFITLKSEYLFCCANSKMMSEKNLRLKCFAWGKRAAVPEPCRASWNKVLQGIFEKVMSKTCITLRVLRKLENLFVCQTVVTPSIHEIRNLKINQPSLRVWNWSKSFFKKKKSTDSKNEPHKWEF